MKEIELTQGKRAIVNDEDHERFSRHNWYATLNKGKWYAVRSVFGKKLYMHRVVCNANRNQIVDHINGDTLDNRIDNLRICNASQNQWNRGKQKNNTSGFKGVTWNKSNQKWEARIYLNGKKIYIGIFDTGIEAARAYDKKAKELHGDFANTNF